MRRSRRLSRFENHMMTFIKEQRGAGTIIEYTIVLPIVMAIIMVLMYTGYIFHDKATMEASAERVALYVAKTISDVNYDTFVDNGDFLSNEIASITVDPSKIENDPYRYLFGAFTSGVDEHAYEEIVRSMVHRNQFIQNDSVVAHVSVDGIIFRKVTVTVTEKFEMPTFLKALSIPIATINTQAVAYVNEPAEFIRNADLTLELLRKADDALGISTKLNELKSQISFFTGTKEGSK